MSTIFKVTSPTQYVVLYWLKENGWRILYTSNSLGDAQDIYNRHARTADGAERTRILDTSQTL